MKRNKENKTYGQKRSEFNPRIIVGVVCSTDIDTLQRLKDFFNTLEGLSLIYLKTSGSPLFITDLKPTRKDSMEVDKGEKSNDS